MEEKRVDPPLGPKRPAITENGSSSSSKRLKVEQHDILPDSALLYHFAYSTWQCANRHLSQTFIPVSVHPIPSDPSMIHLTDPINPTTSKTYEPDARAAEKAVSLQILAIDTLKIGLGLSSLSDTERVTFGLLFGKIGIQVVQALRAGNRKGKGKEERGVDHQKLLQDIEEQVNISMALARKSAYLLLLCQQLELLSLRILLLQGKTGFAKRSVKQYSEAAHRYPAHMYSLQLLLLEDENVLGADGSLLAMTDVLKYAKLSNHHEMTQILLLAQIRLICHQRRWDLLPSALSELGATLGWTEAGFSWTLASCKNADWLAPIAVQFLLYQCLWEGRQGRPERVKVLRKQAFGMMDQASECRAFDVLRRNGGLVDVPILHNGYTSHLTIQTTPPNILYILTYNVALVSHHDISGKQAKAKALVYSNAMRQSEAIPRVEDMWDIGFDLHHGVEDAISLQRQVILIRAGVMLEQAFAFIYRSTFPEADKILNEAIDLLRENDLFSNLAIHILLLRAQSAHLLGQEYAATRYYRAGLANLVPGSELGLVFQIGLLGLSGQLEDVQSRPEVQTQVKEIVERVRVSTNSGLVGVGHFLSSLLETGAHSKTKLRQAFQVSYKNADKLLYVLLYAFLASVDVSGEFKRVEKQLETGKELAKSMGGMDREDGVGHGSLGVWFSKKMSRMYKRSGHEGYAKMAECVEKHAVRNRQLMAYGEDRYGKRDSGK